MRPIGCRKDGSDPCNKHSDTDCQKMYPDTFLLKPEAAYSMAF